MQIIEVNTDGEGQFIRLPSDCAIDSRMITIKKIGRSILLLPTEHNPWETFEESLGQFSDDYMSDRDQPTDVESRVEFQ